MTKLFNNLTKFTLFCLMYTCMVMMAGADEIDAKANAYALYNTNNGSEALKLLEGLSLNEKDAETFVVIANIYEDKNNINKAVEYLNKALIIDPEYYKAYYNLACIFLDKKAYDLAEKNLLLSVKYNKEFPYSYYNLGTLYLRQGEFAKAKKNLIKAIYLKGDEKDFYLNLAYVYKSLGKEKDAKKILNIYNEAK